MNELTKKLGPLPVWGWAAAGGIIYFFFIRPRLSGSSQAQAPSYVQVPQAASGGGTDLQGQNPIDLSPLEKQLTDISNQLQGFMPQQQTTQQQQPTAVQPSNPTSSPVGSTPQPDFTQNIPAGYSLYQPSVGQRMIQYVYNSNPPPSGLTPATVNADLVQRWTAAGKTPAEIAALSGLSNPGAHSSLSHY